MLSYKTETRPGLVALYDIRPGNGAGQFLQPKSPHGANERHRQTESVVRGWPSQLPAWWDRVVQCAVCLRWSMELAPHHHDVADISTLWTQTCLSPASTSPPTQQQQQQLIIIIIMKKQKRRKRCTLAVVRSQKNCHVTDPRPGGTGWSTFNQFEMVTNITYRPSLVKTDARNCELSC